MANRPLMREKYANCLRIHHHVRHVSDWAGRDAKSLACLHRISDDRV
tara:strand:+ start:458 stop:598 length:141 start_codon:yes stop_codon:yes gene_type:complete